MILMFNKQYRQESALISDLAKKIKKSKSVVRVYHESTEVYQLDNIDVRLDVKDSVLTVTDKNNQVIIDMDCRYEHDELQRARFGMFGHLLDVVRDTYKKKNEKVKALQQAAMELNEKQKRLDEAKASKAAAEAKIADARNRLKTL